MFYFSTSMREIAFIKNNKDKWLEFEKALVPNAVLQTDDLAQMYMQLLNDLSYSQTYYPKSKTTEYLNQLVAQTYQKIYKTKRLEENRIKHFFTLEVPLILYEYRNYLYFSFFIFMIFTCIGVLSTHYDLEFVRLILGDQYVAQTLQNIRDGDPMAVYKSGSSFGSFLLITLNNLYVGIRMFMYGIFGGLGTFLFMFYNGIMLGSFQYFFIQQKEFTASFKGIWLHGTLEIAALIIEGAAGYIVGGSLLFPKTFSRLNAFKIGFKNAFKIVLTTIPLTILAGFIEGYITRYAKEMPDLLNYLIIFLSLGFIVFYYIIYPIVLHQSLHKKSSNYVSAI